MTIGYSDYINQLKESGLKTTHLGKGEADFSDYGNALSDEIKTMITDSFDNEQDYELQSEIAALYKKAGKSNLHRKEFVSLLKQNGYKVNVSYVKSSYIVDNKATGKYNNSVADGYASIGMYTISDGKGGEIVIADANGNGALEIEEVFMNQILNDIAVDVNKIQTANVGSVSLGSGADSDLFNEDGNIFNNEEEKVSQTEFDNKVESLLNMGLSLASAELNASASLKADGMRYSGTVQQDEENKDDKKEIKQTSFNKAVESELSKGKTMEEAISLANNDLSVDMKYTGNMEEELEEELDKDVA